MPKTLIVRTGNFNGYRSDRPMDTIYCDPKDLNSVRGFSFDYVICIDAVNANDIEQILYPSILANKGRLLGVGPIQIARGI